MDNTNTRRVLARVAQVDSVTPIEGADRIHLATIGGWKCVTSKDVVPGTKGVFFEIDTVFPKEEWVTTNKFDGIKFVKTAKIRGVLSQGVFATMATLPTTVHELEINTDVTSLLGVTKNNDDVFDDTERVSSRIPFGKVLPYGPDVTDEPRIQNSLQMLRTLVGEPVVGTLKIDGTSMTAFHDGNTLRVLSRNFEVLPDSSVYWQCVEKHDLMVKLSQAPELVFQMEVYGPKIQKNLALRCSQPECKIHGFVHHTFKNHGCHGKTQGMTDRDKLIMIQVPKILCVPCV